MDVAARLAGKLRAFGQNGQVYPEMASSADHMLRLADRSIAADQDFELLIVLRELMGTRPPAYCPARSAMAISPELLGELFA